MARHKKRRLQLSLKRGEAMRVTPVAVGKDKLVYILVADKKLKYPDGRSRIAYIGTTQKGISRIARSIAIRADDILSLHGVREFHARVVTCPPRQNVRTWHKLERALLIEFREMYGDVPHCNTQGNKMKETDEFEYFRLRAVRRVIDDLS